MTFLDLLKGTPIWVWILFAYLIFIGVKSLKTRSVFIPKLFIVPLVLIFTKYDFIVNGTPTL